MRIEENARNRSLQRRRKMVTVGSHPNFLKEPGPSDQTEVVRGLPSGKAKEKSRNNQDRLFGRTRGNDRAPSGEAR
jgi:hypothetical protein